MSLIIKWRLDYSEISASVMWGDNFASETKKKKCALPPLCFDSRYFGRRRKRRMRRRRRKRRRRRSRRRRRRRRRYYYYYYYYYNVSDDDNNNTHTHSLCQSLHMQSTNTQLAFMMQCTNPKLQFCLCQKQVPHSPLFCTVHGCEPKNVWIVPRVVPWRL